MKAAVHMGLIVEMKNMMQRAAIQIDNDIASKILLDYPVFTGNYGNIAKDYSFDIFGRRFDIMRDWEQNHPDQDPFPEVFPRVVVAKIDMLERNDNAAILAVLDELLEMAKAELA